MAVKRRRHAFGLGEPGLDGQGGGQDRRGVGAGQENQVHRSRAGGGDEPIGDEHGRAVFQRLEFEGGDLARAGAAGQEIGFDPLRIAIDDDQLQARGAGKVSAGEDPDQQRLGERRPADPADADRLSRRRGQTVDRIFQQELAGEELRGGGQTQFDPIALFAARQSLLQRRLQRQIVDPHQHLQRRRRRAGRRDVVDHPFGGLDVHRVHVGRADEAARVFKAELLQVEAVA